MARNKHKFRSSKKPNLPSQVKGAVESPSASTKFSLWSLMDRKILHNQKRQSGANQQFIFELRRAAMFIGDKAAKEDVWRHLERAHILGQVSALKHTAVHVVMFSFAVLTRDVRECFGQILRTVLAAPSSLLGLAPRGNSGRSSAGLFVEMPIPPDLLILLEKDRK